MSNPTKSLVQEISRDPLSADLLFTLFSSTVGTKFYDSNAPQPKAKTLEELINTMPPMDQLGSYPSDDELERAIGSESASLLRFSIIDSPSKFSYLSETQEIPSFKRENPTAEQPRCFQFKYVQTPPGKESAFQSIKSKYGSSIYLWHSSSTERWCSINKLGLVSTEKMPQLMRVGNTYGPGIYFNPDSKTSISYATCYDNLYTNSKLGKKISVTAIFEVVNLPDNEKVSVEVDVDGKKQALEGSLSFHGWIYNLTLAEACNARYLLVNLDADVDLTKDKTVTDAFK